MSITSSGVICDVCGQYILLESFDNFTLKGRKQQFHCHSSGDCKDNLFKASKANDYKLLPAESPIRKAFEIIDVKSVPRFKIGQKVKIVKDAQGYKYPTPLDGFTIVAVRLEDHTYQIEKLGIWSEFLNEWQLEVE